MRSLKTKQALRYWARVGLLSLFVAQLILGYTASLSIAQAQDGPLKTDTPAVTNIPVYDKGVDKGIEQYLCTPTDANLGRALYDCIGKVYRFGIAFGAIAVVFFVVYAGYLYIVGGEATKEKGKGVFLSALTGMAIILSSYVLLRFINPDLVKIKPIQAPIFTAADLAKCEDVGFGVTCVLPSGQVGTGGGGAAGSASEAKYKDLIAKYATQNGLEYCHLSALISQESSFIANVYSSPDYAPRYVDASQQPPTYGISFNTYHAIGLTQITIFPKSKGGWVGDTPARSSQSDFGTSPLTLQALLNPETNIAAGAHFFGKLFLNDGKDINKAYGHYFNGAGSNAPPPASLTGKYNACVARTKT